MVKQLQERLIRTWRLARQAKARCGKGLLAQAVDIMRLRFGPGRLGASEYYYYGICDDERYSFAEKQEFVGWRGNARIDAILNDDDWRAVADDKLLFAHLMDGLGLPRPEIHAVYSPLGRSIGEAARLTTVSDALEYLRGPAPYPLFIKPIVGSYGRGALACTGYDPESDAVVLANGKRRRLADLATDFAFAPYHGMLFQELLEPHPEIARICGPRLSTVRVIMLMVDEQPVIHSAVWKVPVGDNMTDNFAHGEPGNLLGHADATSGRIVRVVRGTGFECQIATTHPDTGVSLTEISLPCWQDLIDLCTIAARALPGLGFQHWDLAFCPSGPVMLEVNVEGAVDLHQLAALAGALTPVLRNAMANRHAQELIQRHAEQGARS